MFSTDFSGFRNNITTIETLILNVVDKIQKIGLEIEISESKKTSGGYLGILDLSFSSYKTRICLEISLRKQNSIKGEPVLITCDFIPSYTLLMLPQKMLVGEKLSALLGRAKPRDYFDLYFLLRKDLIEVRKRGILKEISKQVRKRKTLIGEGVARFSSTKSA